jgi:hypothetical protein
MARHGNPFAAVFIDDALKAATDIFSKARELTVHLAVHEPLPAVVVELLKLLNGDVMIGVSIVLSHSIFNPNLKPF